MLTFDEFTRTFSTGATRDADDQKLDYEGFYSPIVLRRFAEYMHTKRLKNIPQGMTIRQSDNWQNGMPLDSFMKSGLRHMIELWLMHDGYEAKDEKGQVLDLEEVLCALIFNAQGYLFEVLKGKQNGIVNRGVSDGCAVGPLSELQTSKSFDAQV